MNGQVQLREGIMKQILNLKKLVKENENYFSVQVTLNPSFSRSRTSFR